MGWGMPKTFSFSPLSRPRTQPPPQLPLEEQMATSGSHPGGFIWLKPRPLPEGFGFTGLSQNGYGSSPVRHSRSCPTFSFCCLTFALLSDI